jgi:hypothetical protein
MSSEIALEITTDIDIDIDIDNEKNIENQIDTNIELNFDKLKELTNKHKKDKQYVFNEKVKIARDNAIKDITTNCYEKMKYSALKGYNTCYLKSFKWEKDKSAITDIDGSIIIFNGIRLLDLITKDQLFFDELNSFFNKSDSDKFYTGFRKENKKENSKYIIYVSWGEKSTKVIEEPENIDITEVKKGSPFKKNNRKISL